MLRRPIIRIILVSSVFGLGYLHSGGALAQPTANATEPERGLWNIPTKTLGGKQLWGDEFYDRGWRIQRNILTGHYRLLDPESVRQAWGTYQQCLQEYRRLSPQESRELREEQSLVILLHGALRAPESLRKMRQRLESEGYEVCAVTYPSSQADINAHAAQLNRLIARLEGVERIDLVGHSMGGLVARAALKERPDPRVGCLVTLGTPHLGAIKASLLKDWFLFKVVMGPAGQQLIAGSEAYAADLGTPPCALGSIAGGKGDADGFSPLIPGDDDGTVGVRSALPPFADDILVIRRRHSALLRSEAAIEATLQFLRAGRFRERDK